MSAILSPGAAAPRSIASLPGPRGLPLIGCLHQFRAERAHLIFESWARQYGPVYKVPFGRRLVVILSDHEATMKGLRARPDDFTRSAYLDSIISSKMYLKNIDIDSALRRLADKRIEDAMREGKLDNLEGKGRPLDPAHRRGARDGDQHPEDDAADEREGTNLGGQQRALGEKADIRTQYAEVEPHRHPTETVFTFGG